MNKNIIIGIIIIAVITGSALFFFSPKSPSVNQNTSSSSQTTTSEEGKRVAGYSGEVLAGTTSPYIVFNKADYNKALSSNKIILLDFYANWCPICRAEAPELKAGFDSLTTDKVVGFRVNFNDSDTDADEKALAQQFNVPYQHTKILLKDGKEIARSSDQWTKDDFIKQVTAVVGQ